MESGGKLHSHRQKCITPSPFFPIPPTSLPKEWQGTKIVYAIDVPPWYLQEDVEAMVSWGVETKGLTEFNVGCTKWSVGAVRTATWASAGPSMGKLTDTVFQSSNSNITTLSSHGYGRPKALQALNTKGLPYEAGRDAADTSLVPKTDPMIIDTVKFSKRKRCS